MASELKQVLVPAFGVPFVVPVPEGWDISASPTPERPEEWEPYTLFEGERETLGLTLFTVYAPFALDTRDALRFVADKAGLTEGRMVSPHRIEGIVEGMSASVAVASEGPALLFLLEVCRQGDAEWKGDALRSATGVGAWGEPVEEWKSASLVAYRPASWTAAPVDEAGNAVDFRLVSGGAVAAYVHVRRLTGPNRPERERITELADALTEQGIEISQLSPIGRDFRLVRGAVTIGERSADALFFCESERNVSGVALLPDIATDPLIWMRGRFAFDMNRVNARSFSEPDVS